MVSCAKRSCNHRAGVDKKKTSGITFHRFPKDPEHRKKWRKIVNRGAWVPTTYSVLCSKHFSEKYIDRTSRSLVRLRDNAVPTIDLMQNMDQEQVVENSTLNPQPGTSADGNLQLESELRPERNSTASFYGPNEVVTPRKRKLHTKLAHTLHVSKERKRKLITARRKLYRREKRIANLKDVITDLKKKRFVADEHLDIISKIGGPKELFLRQYKKANRIAQPQKLSLYQLLKLIEVDDTDKDGADMYIQPPGLN
uniref:THAP domain-containing protein 2-like n=1 Tax=Diabrotica virgifera virgifera TaxID=50390 RepID=A0A6P7H426_DIAVI